jgi:hypothetical protein
MFALLLLWGAALVRLVGSTYGLPDDFRCWITDKPVALPQCGLMGCVHNTSHVGLGWAEYPLTADHLSRSVPYKGDTQRLHEILKAASTRGLNIVVLGGSVPFGHHCALLDGRKEQDCAWPMRLKEWFQQRFPNTDIQLDNAAIGE